MAAYPGGLLKKEVPAAMDKKSIKAQIRFGRRYGKLEKMLVEEKRKEMFLQAQRSNHQSKLCR